MYLALVHGLDKIHLEATVTSASHVAAPETGTDTSRKLVVVGVVAVAAAAHRPPPRHRRATFTKRASYDPCHLIPLELSCLHIFLHAPLPRPTLRYSTSTKNDYQFSLAASRISNKLTAKYITVYLLRKFAPSRDRY